MKRLFIFVILITFFLSGCSEVIQTPPVDRKTPLYESASDYSNRTTSETAAFDIIVNQYGYEPDQIYLLKSSKQIWSDSCLEVAPQSEVCVPEEIPGYLMLFYADNSIFEAHTDNSAEKIYVLNYLSNYANPVEVAILLLAKQLEISSNNVLVQNSEVVDWPDSCLGVIKEDLICVPVLTPGYRIILEAFGAVYEFHADIYGSRLIPIQ